MSGKCGKNITWTIGTDRVMRLTGTGRMDNYADIEERPYNDYYLVAKSVEVGEGITSIGNYAFAHFNVSTSFKIPSTLESIGECAFMGCGQYTSIKIPKKVYSIAKKAFYYSIGAKSIEFESGSVLNYIGELAFSTCKSLESISIPSKVKIIGTYAFQNCQSLTSVNIPNGVTQIGVGGFYMCSLLKSVSIPGSVKVIQNYAFAECTSITSLTLNSGVTLILDGAFSKNKSLKYVSFPDTLVYIGSCSFDDCPYLTSVSLPKYIGNISRNAFGKYTNSNYDTLKVSNFTVIGYKNTEAEKYASSNGFKFISLGSGYRNPTGAQISSAVTTSYPKANQNQRLYNTCAAAENKYYTITDFKNALSKCDYTFPTVSGDYNGDGLTDVAQFYDIQPGEVALDVCTSEGQAAARNTVWTSGKGWAVSNFKGRFASGDYNGDGLDDIAAFYDYGKGECRAFVWISTGSTFKLDWNFWYMSSGFYSDRITNRVTSGDFNGDGKADIAAFYDYGKGETRAFVWKSQGSKFTLDWNYWYMSTGFTAGNISDQIAVGDFDGDKKDDIMAFYDYGKGEARAFIWQSKTTYFKLNWNYWYMSSGFYVSNIKGRITAGDYNGDGKSDVFALYDYGKGEARAFVWLANSSSLSLNWNYWYMKSGFYCSNYGKRIVSGDFNGDGMDDVCAYYTYDNGNDGQLFAYMSNKTWFGLVWNW